MMCFPQSNKPLPRDFFAGKSEFFVPGTPNGDITFKTDLVRKEGKLTGVLKSGSEQIKEPIPIAKIEEDGEKITVRSNESSPAKEETGRGWQMFFDDKTLKKTRL